MIPGARRSLSPELLCGVRRRTLSQRERVIGRAFDRQIGSTKRGDHYGDYRISPDSPSTAILATISVTTSGHPGNLGGQGLGIRLEGALEQPLRVSVGRQCYRVQGHTVNHGLAREHFSCLLES